MPWKSLGISAIATLFLSCTTLAAQDLRISPEDGRSLAIQLLRNNEVAAARTIAETLLSANPQDSTALVLLSQAERALGNFTVARQAGQAAWAYATTDQERFSAATVTAQALASQERPTQAQFWLRRASNFAPNETTTQAITRDYSLLEQLNPLQFRVQFGAAPSSNINNGSSVDSIQFGGNTFLLNPSSQRISGYEFSSSFDLNYRIQENDNNQTSVGGAVNIFRYALTDDSKIRAPNFDVSDRAYNRLDVFVRRDWFLSNGLVRSEFGLGASTLGEDPYTTEVRIAAERIWILGESARLDGSISLVNVNYDQTDEVSQVVSAAINWQKTLVNEDRFGLGLTYVQTTADDPAIANDAVAINATYNFGTVGQNLTLSSGFGYRVREFEPSIITPFGREDRQTTISVDIVFLRLNTTVSHPRCALRGKRRIQTSHVTRPRH
jgi:tetratricopeptide (TPR) repeat protein